MAESNGLRNAFKAILRIINALSDADRLRILKALAELEGCTVTPNA